MKTNKLDDTISLMASRKGPGKSSVNKPSEPGSGRQLFPESNRLSNIARGGAMWSAIQDNNKNVDLDTPITIYRATIGDSIESGDYVAINRDVAKNHLQNLKDRGEKGRIISKKVAASDLLMANDATEFIYSPENNPTPSAEEKDNISEAVSAIRKRGIKGDKLLDVEDLIDEIRNKGAIINPDGTLTLFHRTTEENKATIEKTGFMQGKEDGVFFSTAPTGQAEGYGNAIVKVRIQIEKLELDDVFNDEAHLKISTSKAGQKIKIDIIDYPNPSSSPGEGEQIPSKTNEKSFEQDILNKRLMGAIARGQKDDVQKLIKDGADVNTELEDGNMPLFLACIKGHTEIAQMLIDAGADVNALDDNDNTILDIVCINYFDPVIAQLLVDNGTDVDRRNYSNDEDTTLLHWACWSGNVKIAKFLLENGADVGIRSRDGHLPFHYVNVIGPVDEEKNDFIKLFKEYDPETVLETVVNMGNDDKVREELLTWFQENHPELYFSKFCVTDMSMGA